MKRLTMILAIVLALFVWQTAQAEDPELPGNSPFGPVIMGGPDGGFMPINIPATTDASGGIIVYGIFEALSFYFNGGGQFAAGGWARISAGMLNPFTPGGPGAAEAPFINTIAAEGEGSEINSFKVYDAQGNVSGGGYNSGGGRGGGGAGPGGSGPGLGGGGLFGCGYVSPDLPGFNHFGRAGVVVPAPAEPEVFNKCDELLAQFVELNRHSPADWGLNQIGPSSVIEASPSPCVPVNGPCTTYISWKYLGDCCDQNEIMDVIVRDVGAPDNWYDFGSCACTTVQQAAAAWIAPDHRYEFLLLRASCCAPTVFLGRVIVGTNADGDMAPDNSNDPCPLYGGSQCAEEIHVVSSTRVYQSAVYVQCNSWGSGWYLWGYAAPGAQSWRANAPWIDANGCNFNEYDTGNWRLLRHRFLRGA